MKLIEEVYHSGYKPKWDNDKYAYYVDNTNRDIMYKMVKCFLNSLKHCDVKTQLNIYKINVKQDIWIIYFKSTGLSYDCLNLWPIDNTYAAKHKYNVIKITEPQSLISMD